MKKILALVLLAFVFGCFVPSASAASAHGIKAHKHHHHHHHHKT